ncbi:MAG: hypothetical protein SF123_08680 [Chloroflexota bacterium]|nr:hypothetical protein [Chloroflexota bacterium]
MNTTLTSLIAYYIQRQNLILLAMLDVHPFPLLMGGEVVGGVHVQPIIALYRERESNLAPGGTLQFGIWKRDWKYRVHGIGCQLVHVQTHEPLEWDAPDPVAFRFDWFYEHLLWRLMHEADDPHVRQFRAIQAHYKSYAALESYAKSHNLMLEGQDGLCKLVEHT